eukprot:4678767-Alexandrium_andersonii.AAC.1
MRRWFATRSTLSIVHHGLQLLHQVGVVPLALVGLAAVVLGCLVRVLLLGGVGPRLLLALLAVFGGAGGRILVATLRPVQAVLRVLHGRLDQAEQVLHQLVAVEVRTRDPHIREPAAHCHHRECSARWCEVHHALAQVRVDQLVGDLVGLRMEPHRLRLPQLPLRSGSEPRVHRAAHLDLESAHEGFLLLAAQLPHRLILPGVDQHRPEHVGVVASLEVLVRPAGDIPVGSRYEEHGLGDLEAVHGRDPADVGQHRVLVVANDDGDLLLGGRPPEGLQKNVLDGPAAVEDEPHVLASHDVRVVNVVVAGACQHAGLAPDVHCP